MTKEMIYRVYDLMTNDKVFEGRLTTAEINRFKETNHRVIPTGSYVKTNNFRGL